MGDNQMHKISEGRVDKGRLWICPKPLRTEGSTYWNHTCMAVFAGRAIHAADRENSLIGAWCGETDRFGLLDNELVLFSLGSVLPVYMCKGWRGRQRVKIQNLCGQRSFLSQANNVVHPVRPGQNRRIRSNQAFYGGEQPKPDLIFALH